MTRREPVPTYPAAASASPRGHTSPLYILPFDHRASFERTMFGWTGALSDDQAESIAAAKRVIYDGFRVAVTAGVSKESAGLLVDERFGASILRDARANGYITCAPAEKSGQDEFDFEFGDEFAQHIELFAPTFCKVLVRYNPDGDTALNGRQAVRLERLSRYLGGSASKYMFELLVPATAAQLQTFAGDTGLYDRELRPTLMVRAMRELQDAGVEPDVWKVEGLDRREEYEHIAETAQRGGRSNVGCIVLGRGESEDHVRRWLSTAAGVRGFIGFAVGRTTFWDALIAFRDDPSSRSAAVEQIAHRYRQWFDVFEEARAAADRGDTLSNVAQNTSDTSPRKLESE